MKEDVTEGLSGGGCSRILERRACPFRSRGLVKLARLSKAVNIGSSSHRGKEASLNIRS